MLVLVLLEVVVDLDTLRTESSGLVERVGPVGLRHTALWATGVSAAAPAG